MARSTGRYTSGKLRTDLRHVMRRISDNDRDDSLADRRLADLTAARSIQHELQLLIDQTVVTARRSPPVLTWRAIGEALGVSGQAVGQHSRDHDLSINSISSDDYHRRVREALGHHEPHS